MKSQFSLFEGTVHFKDKFWNRVPCSLREVKTSCFVYTFLESPIVIWRKSCVQEVPSTNCHTGSCLWNTTVLLACSVCPLRSSSLLPSEGGTDTTMWFWGTYMEVCAHATLIATIPKDSRSWKICIAITWVLHTGCCSLSLVWRIRTILLSSWP